MRSHNPAYGLWNDGEDEFKSRKNKGTQTLDKQTEEKANAKKVHECYTYHADVELLKKGIIRKVDE